MIIHERRVCFSEGVLKRLEEEDLDDGVRKRLKDSSETPGALWHIYLNRDMDKVRDFLHKVSTRRNTLKTWLCEFSEFQRSADLENPFPPLQQQPPQLSKEQGLDVSLDQDSIRKHAWYLSRKQRQRLLDEHGVQGWTVVQFLGDSVLIPAGAMHQVFTTHTHWSLTDKDNTSNSTKCNAAEMKSV